MHRFVPAALAVAIAAVLLTGAAAAAAPPPSDRYLVTPLVSNNPSLAPVTDPNVQNAWGLARSATSPWWFSDNGAAKTSVYNASGGLVSVGGQPAQGVPGAPTGAVFSGIPGQFQVGTVASPTTLGTSNFVFDSEDGTISAWRGGSTAALVTVNLAPFGAEFKGLAISNGPSGPRLYATDFANAQVDVVDGSWTQLHTPGAFVDPKLPKDFAPFGIQTIGNRVFVTYAKQGAGGDEVDKKGLGIVDAYDLDGNLLARVAQHGELDAPWGLAWAPDGFGRFGGDLLVGNFGDGQINAYEETSDGRWQHRGTLKAADDGKPGDGKLTIDGLWALEFGNGAPNNGSAQTLFFTAGPNDEADGLFGTITASS